MAQPRTASEFSTAQHRFAEIRDREAADPRINPDCASILLDHGAPRAKAIVLLHGITSSPRQFADLGQRFFERGYNVLIPRMPEHGYRDRLTKTPKDLTATDLENFASQAIAIGKGLGEHLTLTGLSVSGTLAAWCAQTSADLDQAVLLAPAFAPYGVPMSLVKPLSILAMRLPNLFLWWDPRKRARLGPATSYPRFSTHAMATAFRLGADVYDTARTTPPRTTEILCVVNMRDPAVNNRATGKVLARWRRHGAHVREHTFRGELGRLHDFIGPYQPGARPELVYPLLVDFVDRRA